MTPTRVDPVLDSDPPARTTLEDSYRYAARLTRASARNFAYGFWFLSPERRRSIAVIYAYSRRLDDCVDASMDGSIEEVSLMYAAACSTA